MGGSGNSGDIRGVLGILEGFGGGGDTSGG